MRKRRLFKSKWTADLPWAVHVPNAFSDFPFRFFATWEEARDYAFGVTK